MKKTVAIVVFSFLFTAFAAGNIAADEIHEIGGNVIKDIEVSKETYEKITYRYKGIRADQYIQAREVARVVHTNKPVAYRDGEDMMRRLHYKEAIENFKKAMQGAKGGWVEQYSRFNVAECYRLLGNVNAAVSAYEELLKKFPKTRFLPFVRSGIGEAYLAQGQIDKARRAFKDLESEATTKGFGDIWRYRAQIHEGDVLFAEKKYRNAQRKYRRVAVGTSATHPRVAVAALVKEAAAWKELGDVARAKRQIGDIIEKDIGSELMAAAYNVLGECHWEQKQFKEALFAFLRVVVLYKDVIPEQPKALYYASKCFEKVKGKDWRKRSRDLSKRLKGQYPNSPWAAR